MIDNRTTARGLLAEALSLPLAQVPGDASAATLPAWDSLGHLRLVNTLEERLGRELEVEEMLSVMDLDAIAKLL